MRREHQMLETISLEIAVLAVLISFTIATYYLKLLSTHGIILANLIGIVVFVLGGAVPFATLIIFYVIAEVATWIGRKSVKKHEQRTSSNIFGNCAAAIVALFFGQHIAFFGAISAAFADTISSEIGLLSRGKPWLITTFKKVEKGTDGAVSLLGSSASLVAAVIFGAVYYFFVQASGKLFIAIVAAGFFGGVCDSFLGATFQRKGIITNTQVNFLASIFGAAVAIALAA